MSFALLSTLFVLGGIAALAILLWLAQRLRVEHREVEVLSTLFWQAAIEETRARVFVRRFRDWPAWFLLVAIASLLWMLLAGPQTDSIDGRHHVVMVDWSVKDMAARENDLQLAISRAATLPTTAREIVAVSNRLETLLKPGEPVKMAAVRAIGEATIAPRGIDWAIESLSTRASEEHPLTLHLVGNADVDQARLAALGENLNVHRIARPMADSQPELQTLGIANAASGRWDAVDIWFALSGEEAFDGEITVRVDDDLYSDSIAKRDLNTFELSDVIANGGTLTVEVDGESLGSITLPRREPIRVAAEPDVPETIRQLIDLDRACELVSADAEVRIGFDKECNFRLSADDQPAFVINSEQDPNAVLGQLVDKLALQQIDGTSIAEQSGRLVDVQVRNADNRSIEIWGSLFSSSFDFRESRACPVLVSRSIRWLANRPPLIPWAEQGQKLPIAGRRFDRVISSTAMTRDGREIHAARIAPIQKGSAELTDSSRPNVLSRFSLYMWLGLLVSALLVGEWVLYQRGRLP